MYEADSGASREPQVQIAVMVPASVKRAVRRRAETDGLTVRALLLRMLKEAGVAAVAEAEIADQRAVAAALKSRLYREATQR